MSSSFAELGVPAPCAPTGPPRHQRALPHPGRHAARGPRRARRGRQGAHRLGKTLAFGLAIAQQAATAGPVKPDAPAPWCWSPPAAGRRRCSASCPRSSTSGGTARWSPSTAAWATARGASCWLAGSARWSPAPDASRTWSAPATSCSTGPTSWCSTRPTAWPTWASCPPCAGCSTRRPSDARPCCSRPRSTATSTSS